MFQGQRSTGVTPLMFAAKNRSIEATDVLLHEGANPNTVDSYGRTALFCALQSKDMKTIDKLCGLTKVSAEKAFQKISDTRINISGPLLTFITKSIWNTGRHIVLKFKLKGFNHFVTILLLYSKY